MVVEAYIGLPFEHTVEREAADLLLKAMQSSFHSRPEMYFLIENISIYGCQIDFLVLKPNAVIVIELKHIPGPFTASENGDWKSGEKVFDNNGENPMQQVLRQKEIVFQYLEANKKRIKLEENTNLRHISTFICISPAIH